MTNKYSPSVTVHVDTKTLPPPPTFTLNVLVNYSIEDIKSFINSLPLHNFVYCVYQGIEAVDVPDYNEIISFVADTSQAPQVISTAMYLQKDIDLKDYCQKYTAFLNVDYVNIFTGDL